MNDETVGRVHWSFWAIGAVMLIYNVAGVINFSALSFELTRGDYGIRFLTSSTFVETWKGYRLTR